MYSATAAAADAAAADDDATAASASAAADAALQYLQGAGIRTWDSETAALSTLNITGIKQIYVKAL